MFATMPPTAMSVQPAEVSGPSRSHATFTLTDTGSRALVVRVQGIELRPVAGTKGWAPYGEYDHATVSPERFTLKPGQHRAVKVSVSSPDRYRHDIGVLAYAEPGKAASGAAIAAGVAARYVINQGAPMAPGQKPVSQPQHPASGTPWGVPAGIGAAVLAALAASAAWLRRRREVMHRS